MEWYTDMNIWSCTLTLSHSLSHTDKHINTHKRTDFYCEIAHGAVVRCSITSNNASLLMGHG